MRTTIFLLIILFAASCGENNQTQITNDAEALQIWAHAGQAAEREVLEQQVARFNALQEGFQAKLTFIPEGDYNAQVQAAAIAGDLPDVLEFDGPFVYNYVWQGHLRPLDDLIDAEIIQDLLPSILAQGRYRGALYALGTFDSGLGLYARRSQLTAAGVRIPSGAADAWTDEEFATVLQALAAQDEDGAVLDLKLNYAGEWYTYAFSPVLQSAGGDLIEREGYQSAQGVLNGPAAVAAMGAVQDWIGQGYVDPNVDDAAFAGGRVALSWVGHWEYRRYQDAAGDDLILLPLPDFGQGAKTGQGSWAWGISAASRQPEAAAAFIEFLLQTDEVLAISEANGAVPATQSAIAKSQLYRQDGPLALFVEQLQGGYSVPRPQTPAYPVITSAFQQVFANIRNGMAVQQALDEAVLLINRDIQDNKGYPPQTP